MAALLPPLQRCGRKFVLFSALPILLFLSASFLTGANGEAPSWFSAGPDGFLHVPIPPTPASVLNSLPPAPSPSPAPSPDGGYVPEDFPEAPAWFHAAIPPTPASILNWAPAPAPAPGSVWASNYGLEFPQALLTEELFEKNILLQLKKALGNHPVFDAAYWNETYANNATGDNHNAQSWRPCTPGQLWPLVECINGHVAAIKLESNVFADPSNLMDFTNANQSWAKTGSDPLQGTLPWDIIMQLPYLVEVSIQGTLVGGDVLPQNIHEATHLLYLRLYNNAFSGTIPPSITKLANLSIINLSMNNKITGGIPADIGQMSQLRDFSVYSNQLSGPIPAVFGAITGLTVLDLGQNLFNGTVPPEFGNLANLEFLSLQGSQLTGSLPDSLTNLRALKTLDLSQNLLEQPFPAWLANVSTLENLLLNSNQFYGPVPAGIFSLRNISQVDISLNYFNGTVPEHNTITLTRFNFQSNCFNSTLSFAQESRPDDSCRRFYDAIFPQPTAENKNSSIPLLALVVPFSAGVLIMVLVAAFVYWRKRRADQLKQLLFGKNLKQTVKAFSLRELKRATKNFSQVLGRGGYGTVYKAALKGGAVVAVKRLDQISKQGDVEFIREVELLSRLHHRHLVNLVGFCAERGERMLVYEYMAMGSLHEHLHGRSAKEYPLSWDSRTKIAIHVALGLEYLHYGADPPLIHRDIKSANILLSDDGYSKVADFGLCKEAPLGADGSEKLVPTATAVRGSFGYLDPEYVNTSVLSEKSDVYSYGVVLLELISGHKSIHEWQPLAYWAEEYLADREKTPLMVDPALEGNFDLDELYALCDIARTCVQDQAVLRPTIRDVAKALVENLGHALSSYGGSVRDSASVLSSSHSETSSNPSTTLDEGSQAISELSHQQYSATLQWTPARSEKQSGTVPKNAGAKNAANSATGTQSTLLKPKQDEEAGSDNNV